MRLIARGGLAAFAGAAALALSMAVVAHAQQPQRDTVPMTEAQIDAEAVRFAAGVKRLKEVLGVLNAGDYATIRAYFEANSVRVFAVPPGAKPFRWEEGAFSQLLATYRRSRGLDLMRVRTEPSRGDVVGIVRNRLTGDE